MDIKHRSSRLIENIDELTDLLKALANKTRLIILDHLINGEISVGELARIADLSQSTLSQHLGRLRSVNLVTARRDAQNVYYSISSPTVRKMLAVLSKFYVSEIKAR
ncbi:metalloregulator ArsR/SmtB family transcription factor [Brucella sp. NBRC 12950]|jgi:DNA-binding transcriptional ArsR family regulator|uniref:ArsR/SmtB family transcription factor n=1 Tax=Brucella sp. NBRC 12950 TaxID=2994518 RepID=UPI0024A00451|nr:metalloregulator ArsR/SmtB family transcription factor [Brucella sp. NBRC 12950]GLU29511.1 transcriptional regulator [Brucella sp. NBRC 12950]